jgi:Sec-independent protein translocase protein TatA
VLQPENGKLPRATAKIGAILRQMQENPWSFDEERETGEKNLHQRVQKTWSWKCKIHSDEKKMHEDSLPDEYKKMSSGDEA